jgi:hypothetical protein
MGLLPLASLWPGPAFTTRHGCHVAEDTFSHPQLRLHYSQRQQNSRLRQKQSKLRNCELRGSVQLFPPRSAQCTPCVTSDHEIMKCLICAWHRWDCPKMGYSNNLQKYHGYCIHHLIIIVPDFPNWNGHFVVSSWGFPVLPGDAESVIESRRLRASCHCSPSSHQQGQQNSGKKTATNHRDDQYWSNIFKDKEMVLKKCCIYNVIWNNLI